MRRVFGGGDSNAIKVRGHNDLLVYRARCCNPIRGEDIVGYVTRGKGVAVHSRNCPNVTNLLYEDRKSTRLNSSHVSISYAVFCLKKKKKKKKNKQTTKKKKNTQLHQKRKDI